MNLRVSGLLLAM